MLHVFLVLGCYFLTNVILAWTIYFSTPSHLSWAYWVTVIYLCILVFIYIYLVTTLINCHLVTTLINCHILCFFVCSLRILLSHHYQFPRTSLCRLIAECQTSTLCLFDLWSRRWCHLLRHSPWAIASAEAQPKWVASASCVLLDSCSVVLAWHAVHASGLTYILCYLKYWHTPGHYSIKSVILLTQWN